MNQTNAVVATATADAPQKVDKSILRLDWCSVAAARYACEHWYYTASYPASKTVRVGAWERGQFVGVVMFGSGANSGLVHPYGLEQTEGCELVRVAFRQHETPLTRILSLAISKFLVPTCPGLRLIVSFADSTVHHGGIYQGSGWLYLGDTAPPKEYEYQGRHWHGRSLRSSFGTSKLPGVTTVLGTPKHRYVYPLDDAMRNQLQSQALPFPKKRLESVASDTPPCQTGNDGCKSRIEAPLSCATSLESEAPDVPVGRGTCNSIVALPSTSSGATPGAPRRIPTAPAAAQTEGGVHDAE